MKERLRGIQDNYKAESQALLQALIQQRLPPQLSHHSALTHSDMKDERKWSDVVRRGTMRMHIKSPYKSDESVKRLTPMRLMSQELR